jgi:uncharacterized protein YajQ (UPF0234 family)
MSNLMSTIRGLYENPEDMEPASPDEKSMGIKQAEFIQYVGREVKEHLEAGKEFPEWMQNKLSGLNEKAKDMHATLGDHGGDDVNESVELEEAVDPKVAKAATKLVHDLMKKKTSEKGIEKAIDTNFPSFNGKEYIKLYKAAKKRIDTLRVGKTNEKGILKAIQINFPSLDAKEMMKEGTVTSVADVKAPVATPNKSGTVNKVANHPGSIKPPVTLKKESIEIDEALEVKIGGGKVPVGQHKLKYNVDKPDKYIENSIKDRDPKAKFERKGKDLYVTASAQAHSSVIASLRKFRVDGTVSEGLEDPKDNPCWKGYEPVGTKKKNGKTVPNCVPKENVKPAKNKKLKEFLNKGDKS